jgi:gliding motility-associated protein GldM
MSLPKEPRQRMINFMYLVLTAMLALNVSSEIINAFKIVNSSLVLSNKMISEKNHEIYRAFDNMATDPRTMEKAAIWKPKAEQVKQLSTDMYNYIEQLQHEVKTESRLKVVNGEETFSYDNLNVPTRLMEKKGKGRELYEKLVEYRRNVLSVLSANNFTDEVLQKQVERDAELFRKTIPIDLTAPVGNYGTVYPNDAGGWTSGNFYMTPSIAAVTILSKLQNDVKNTEARLVDYCYKQINSVEYIFDNFQAIAQANTSYAMPGDEIEITAGIGAFSNAAKPDIIINGEKVPLTTKGTAVWKTKAAGEGKKVVDVTIEYTKPDGTRSSENRQVTYEVGRPAGVAVSPNKMNVLYLGVENPLTITAGVGSEKVNATFGTGEIRRNGGNQWTAIPKTAGMQTIDVTADGKTTPVTFRVRRLPDPYAYVGGRRGGAISSAIFKAQGGMIAKLESEFDVEFKVISYKVGAMGGPIPYYQQQQNYGAVWSGAAKKLIELARPGTAVFFDDIKVVGPDGTERELPQMSFNLK